MSGFISIFGGTAISPAQPQYEPITLSGNVTLVWPLESDENVPYVAAQIDVNPTGGGFDLIMPNAETGSTGIATVISNVGGSSFTLMKQDGVTAIQVIAAGTSFIITLTANTTANGTWRSLQLASTTSSAVAAALAGAGLQAIGSQLQVYIATAILGVNTTITTTYRANLVIWNGAGGTFQMDTITNLTVGFWCAFSNEGTGNLTITGTAGQTINGAGSLVLAPGLSCLIVCAAGGFNTIGAFPAPLAIDAGGTGAETATGALTNFGGTSIGQSIFTAPSAAAVLALLGISPSTNFTITESSVSTNQALVGTGATGTAFVCTAALIITLPLSTTLTTSYVLFVIAQGGAVTIQPNAADAISGQAAATTYVLAPGASAMIVTDANGNFYMMLFGGGSARAPAFNATINVAVSDAILLVDCSGGTVTVNLSAEMLQPVTIKDVTGNAGANNIIIVPAAGSIDGAAQLVLSSNFEWATLVFSPTGYAQIA